MDEKDLEIIKLNKRIKALEEKIIDSDMISQTSPPPDNETPASSPISYLWSQSTIQCPVRDYQNPNWKAPTAEAKQQIQGDPNSWGLKVIDAIPEDNLVGSITRTVSPIQKPLSSRNSECGRIDNSDNISIGSGRSIGSHSVASTYNM